MKKKFSDFWVKRVPPVGSEKKISSDRAENFRDTYSMSHYHTVKISVRSNSSYYHFDLIKTDGQTDRHPASQPASQPAGHTKLNSTNLDCANPNPNPITGGSFKFCSKLFVAQSKTRQKSQSPCQKSYVYSTSRFELSLWYLMSEIRIFSGLKVFHHAPYVLKYD